MLNRYRLRFAGSVAAQVLVSAVFFALVLIGGLLLAVAFTMLFVERWHSTTLQTTVGLMVPAGLFSLFAGVTFPADYSTVMFGERYRLQLRKQEEARAQAGPDRVLVVSHRVRSSKHNGGHVWFEPHLAPAPRTYLTPTAARMLPIRPEEWGTRTVTRCDPKWLRFSRKHPMAYIIVVCSLLGWVLLGQLAGIMFGN